MSENETTGLGRRDLIKRGAVVGGALVWATPVVQSMATPAFATAGSPNCSYEIITFRNGVCTAAFDCTDPNSDCCTCRETTPATCSGPCRESVCREKPCPKP